MFKARAIYGFLNQNHWNGVKDTGSNLVTPLKEQNLLPAPQLLSRALYGRWKPAIMEGISAKIIQENRTFSVKMFELRFWSNCTGIFV